MLSSGMWRCVDPGLTDVSAEHIASIFSLEVPADAGSPLTDYSTMKMEAIHSFETSVNPGSIQSHIPQDDILLCPCYTLTISLEFSMHFYLLIYSFALNFHVARWSILLCFCNIAGTIYSRFKDVLTI
jgi:hypothetical protein